MTLAGFSTPQVSLPALILVSMTSIVLLLSRNWRWMILALMIQYVGVFMLVALSWSLGMAAVKLVAGWMSGALLVVGMLNAPQAWYEEERFAPSGRLFRLLAISLLGFVVLSLGPGMTAWLPGIGMEKIWGSLILISMGLLHLALTAQPFRVGIGLLTVLSGFEILYAAVETSALVAGLQAGTCLGLALVSAYLLMAPNLEGVE